MRAALALALAMVLPAASAAQGERVPDAAVVDGVPRGIFVGRSLVTGRAVCLLFLSGGRVTRAIPEGGLEHFDWPRHRAAHTPDSGTWQMRGGQLIVNWGDGGVHQGPLTVHADSIEFYGKRYLKPATVDVAAIAGRWESARGTAVTGGAGINRVSELVVTADGRYQWGGTTGGAVSGRAVATDRSMTGRVTVTGLTITFAPDAGPTTSYTFLPAAGTPVSAFGVDADMFTRVGPAPASVPPSSGAPRPQPDAPRGSADSANTYQGLAFTLPQGWTSDMVQGLFVLSPSNATPETAVIVVLYGAETLTSSFDDYLRARMAADLRQSAKVVQSAPPTRAKSGELDVLSAGRTVEDGAGAVVLQIYYGVSNGTQAGLAMVATASEAALRSRMPAVQEIFQSLRFGPMPDTAQPASSPLASTRATGGPIGAADLVGSWSHASSAHTRYSTASGGNAGSTTTAHGQGCTLDADGTYPCLFTGVTRRH